MKYRFITTNSASQTSNCESGEEFEADTGYGGFIGGPTGPVSTDDIDTWQLDGVLNYFTAFTGDDEFIKFEQQGF